MTQLRPGAMDYFLLLVLAGIWGASFLFIKIAVGTVPPLTMTAARLVIAFVLLYVAARHAGQEMPTGARTWGLIVLAAVFGNAAPFALISWGEEHIDSGLAAILMAVMPLTTVLLAHFLTSDEKLSVLKLVGVTLGLAGLVVLIGPAKLAQLGDDTIRQLAVAAAALCYGINAIVTKRVMNENRRALAACIMFAAMMMMVPASLLFERPWTLEPTREAILATVLLGVFQTGVALLLTFAIIRRQGASFFSQINFLVPLFGVAWGALILAERPSGNAYVALALILLGVAVARSAAGRTAPRAPGTA